MIVGGFLCIEESIKNFMKFTPISFKLSAANCPICGAYANFDWGMLQLSRRIELIWRQTSMLDIAFIVII